MPSASANFGNWMYSGDEFTEDGIEYYVLHEFGEDKVFLSVDESNIIVRLDECTEYKGIEYCFTEKEEDLDSSNIKYSEGEVYAGLKLTASEVRPEIGITRAASKTELRPGDSSVVTITLENTGNRYVDNYFYTESFPDEIEIVEADSGSNNYSTRGGLSPGQKRNIAFTLIAHEKITYSSKGKINYTYEGKSFLEETSSIQFRVVPEYSIELYTPENVDLGEVFNSTLRIENNANNSELSVDYAELYVDSLEIVSADENLTSLADRVTWSGDIDSGDEQEFEVSLRAQKVKNNIIVLKATFTLGSNPEKTFEEVFSVRTVFSGPDLELSVNPQNAISGSDITLKMDAVNENNVQLEFFDIKISAFGDTVEHANEFLAAEGEEAVLEKVMTVPDVESETSYDILVSGRYGTPWDEGFPFSEKTSVTVAPKGVSLEVSEDFPDNATPGSNIEGIITVVNGDEEDYEVEIHNFVEPSMGGEQVETLDISAGSSSELQYSFMIPGDFSESSITVHTIVTSESDDYRSEKLSIIEIDIPEDVPVNESASAMVAENTDEEEESSGFFDTFMDNVKEFFSWVGSLF